MKDFVDGCNEVSVNVYTTCHCAAAIAIHDLNIPAKEFPYLLHGIELMKTSILGYEWSKAAGKDNMYSIMSLPPKVKGDLSIVVKYDGSYCLVDIEPTR